MKSRFSLGEKISIALSIAICFFQLWIGYLNLETKSMIQQRQLADETAIALRSITARSWQLYEDAASLERLQNGEENERKRLKQRLRKYSVEQLYDLARFDGRVAERLRNLNQK